MLGGKPWCGVTVTFKSGFPRSVDFILRGKIFIIKTCVICLLWSGFVSFAEVCQGHSSLDAPSELNPPQRIPSPLSIALLVPQAEG